MADEQQIEEETAENVEEVEETEDIQTDDDNDTEGEEDGEESDEKAELEPWEITGEEEDAEKPEKTLKQKKAWKREKAAVNEELEKTKAELEALRTKANTQASTELKRPDRDDYEDDDQYEEDYAQYLLDKVESKKAASKIDEKNKALIDKRNQGIAIHNERVSDFVEEKKINPDVYAAAESTFISAIDDYFPGQGEMIADDFLSKLGEGSEKIPFFLGRNAAKRAEFQALLKEDPTGIKAAMFLGDQNRKLRGATTGKIKSKAPKPAATATGNKNVVVGSATEKGLKKKYDDAHRKGQGSVAMKIKREAKKEHKIDTSKW